MSEIKSEIPTDEELNTYFQAYWQEQDESIKKLSAKYEIDFHRTFENLHDSILKSLQRLNKLARDNSFWNNTNKRPTIYKLDDYCNLLLKENPNDTLALWTKIALVFGLGFGTANPESLIQVLGELKDSNVLATDFLVEIYLIEYLMSGDNSEDFVKLLIELNSVEEFSPHLKNLELSNNEDISNWAKSVLDKINTK
jgi:hypothetical protein